MYNVHFHGKSYQNTSSCFSDFQGAAMGKGSQNKSQNLSSEVQVFQMPWPDQFQDWCFQGSSPRIILVTSLKIKTVIVHITYVRIIPNASDGQTGLADDKGSRACEVWVKTNKWERIYFSGSTITEGEEGLVERGQESKLQQCWTQEMCYYAWWWMLTRFIVVIS